MGIGDNDYLTDYNTDDVVIGGHVPKKKLCRSTDVFTSSGSKHLKSLNIGKVCNSSNSSTSNSNRFVDLKISHKI